MIPDRYICVHGHFYQPPRENPWTGAIDVQEGAHPYHDWNEKITAECYEPNARARILEADGGIAKTVNNYERISFDFGPTILSWLKLQVPSVYTAILEADRHSVRRYGGHGSAIAQAYNHMILPLANARDKRTQIVWGYRDFAHRFERPPEGMWLPECAVDSATLDILCDHGIRFTILASHQVRPAVEPVDPRTPYWIRLPSGRKFAAFVYNGPLAHAVSFEGLLNNGDEFVRRLLGGFAAVRSGPQLVHIATDGESYGHHHRFGEMALAYALEKIESPKLAVITNYGEYLEHHPPTQTVDLIENTSWSCAHGVERWRRDCGCHSGAHPDWHQRWRAPLREAFDWLRDALAPHFKQQGSLLLKDPWSARDDYIDVVVDPAHQSRTRFLKNHAQRNLTVDEQDTVWKLLEMQRHLMLTYTSCAWFFDDPSGIETVTILQYAARAIQLGCEAAGFDAEPGFVERLRRAESNLPDAGDGSYIYQTKMRPAFPDVTAPIWADT